MSEIVRQARLKNLHERMARENLTVEQVMLEHLSTIDGLLNGQKLIQEDLMATRRALRFVLSRQIVAVAPDTVPEGCLPGTFIRPTTLDGALSVADPLNMPVDVAAILFCVRQEIELDAEKAG